MNHALLHAREVVRVHHPRRVGRDARQPLHHLVHVGASHHPNVRGGRPEERLRTRARHPPPRPDHELIAVEEHHLRLDVGARRGHRLSRRGHRRDEVAPHAERGEEGVEVAGQAEGHGLDKLGDSLAVERGVKVQHEHPSGVLGEHDLLRGPPAEAQERGDEARQRVLVRELPLERPQVRPGGQRLVHVVREDVLGDVILRDVAKRLQSKVQDSLRTRHLTRHRVVERLLEQRYGQIRLASVPSAIDLVHLAVRAVRGVVFHEPHLRPHWYDGWGVVRETPTPRLHVV